MSSDLSLDQKLERIESRIKEPDFLANKGLGNEVGYFVFDYEPQYELSVRKHINHLLEKIRPERDGFELVEYDIYNLMIDKLEEESVLQDCMEIEKTDDMDYLLQAISELLNLSNEHNYFAEHIENNTPEQSVVFITGVGKAFPFIRSHKILNNLHQVFDRSPVVMFYPGKYDGLSLKLFGEFKDDNYYRAFPLIR